jgi:predicted DNA-binding transcriptional regulator
MKIMEEEKRSMITDYKINQMTDYDLLSFLKDIGCSDIQFRLLCFWGRHPKSRLSLYTVARALDTVKVNLRNAIRALVGKGILTEQHDNNGLTTYALSASLRIQRYIDELAKLDWSETIKLRKQLKKESGPPSKVDELVPSLITEEIDFQCID